MAKLQKTLNSGFKSLTGFTCLVIFYLIGLGIQHLSHAPIPGSVIGMALLFLALNLVGDQLPRYTLVVGQRLISLLALLLLPAAVGIYFLPDEFNKQLFAIIGATVFGTILSMILTNIVLTKLLKGSPITDEY